MTAIIAYGTVVRSPIVIGLPLPNEERSAAFSIVVEEDFGEDDEGYHKRALYRIIVSGEISRYAELHLKVGSSVMVRGELFEGYPPVGDPSWNHRVVFGAEVVILTGELPHGRAYPLEVTSPPTEAHVAGLAKVSAVS